MTLPKTFSVLNKTMAIMLLIVLSVNVHAKQKRFLYSSFKTGTYLVDIKDYSESGTPLGIQLGYDYGNDWSIELEWIHDTFKVDKQGLTADVALSMWGGYATYRYPSQLYYLVKLGITEKRIEDPHNGTATRFNDVEWTYGLGGGFRFNGKYSVELEYTQTKPDLTFVGLSLRRYFDFHGTNYR